MQPLKHEDGRSRTTMFRIVERGIQMGNDFSGKNCMRTYGEWGSTAAFAFCCQRLLELGHEDWVRTLTVETPARLLAF